MIGPNDFKSFQYNILGPQTTINGNVSFSGDAIITASIEGNVTMLNNSNLILERGSKVNGSIKAFNLEVFGEIQGDIQCEGSLAIRSSAQVSGSIKAKKLIIYPGAVVDTEAISQG